MFRGDSPSTDWAQGIRVALFCRRVLYERRRAAVLHNRLCNFVKTQAAVEVLSRRLREGSGERFLGGT